MDQPAADHPAAVSSRRAISALLYPSTVRRTIFAPAAPPRSSSLGTITKALFLATAFPARPVPSPLTDRTSGWHYDQALSKSPRSSAIFSVRSCSRSPRSTASTTLETSEASSTGLNGFVM